jgi:hypothetical protein
MYAQPRLRHLDVSAIAVLMCVAGPASGTGQERPLDAVATASREITAHTVGFTRSGTNVDVEGPSELPVSLLLPKGLRPVLERMWAASPTFRRQCARLSEAAVPITVSIGLPRGITAARAFTRIERRDGSVTRAYVYLDATLARAHEDVAHEFEHVLEQVDGVDLAGLLANGVHGVRTDGLRRVLETARAAAIGRLVSHEVSRRRRHAVSAPATGAAATDVSAGG